MKNRPVNNKIKNEASRFSLSVIKAAAPAGGPKRALDADGQKLSASIDPTLSTSRLCSSGGSALLGRLRSEPNVKHVFFHLQIAL